MHLRTTAGVREPAASAFTFASTNLTNVRMEDLPFLHMMNFRTLDQFCRPPQISDNHVVAWNNVASFAESSRVSNRPCTTTS